MQGTMRQATERDLRKDHLRDADPADYEVREDGEVVRKDRWEVAIRAIAGALGWSRHAFEVADVERIVIKLIERCELSPVEAWTDDDGDVLWYRVPINEPPYLGTPGDSNWTGPYTHFQRLPPISDEAHAEAVRSLQPIGDDDA